ncbi:MAG: Crp/Fnr family transcriptional regulator [Deltaproteobacteria bacterium]|nr:Crp/Fnr family transcriptional regulator [Deltaproteobacteria bacterium]
MRAKTIGSAEHHLLEIVVQCHEAGCKPTIKDVAEMLGEDIALVTDRVEALKQAKLIATRGRVRVLHVTQKGRNLVQSEEARLPALGLDAIDGLAASLDVLRPHLRARHFDVNEFLWREGQHAGMLVLIQKGRVQAYREPPDGRGPLLYTFGPKDVFGFLPLLDGEPYPATCEAIEPTDALVMTRNGLSRAVAEDPQVAIILLSALGKRLRQAFSRVQRLTAKSALARVAAELVDLTGGHFEAGGLTVVDLPRSHRQFAEHIGLTAETLSRTITHLVQQKIIHRIGPGQLQILDPDGLKLVAQHPPM